jgi:hypothetical protein
MIRGVLLLLALATFQAGPPPLTLELRIFNGAEDVTAETRVTVYRAGDRSEAIAQIAPRAGAIAVPVPQGFYDVQAIREHDGRVLNIRWAERLIVMPYPDEGGRHLEVINFKNDFGALQIRTKDSTGVPRVALYAAGAREKEVATAVAGDNYALFVAPAGTYDLLVRGGAKPEWHGDIDLPLDRTRLWIVP